MSRQTLRDILYCALLGAVLGVYFIYGLSS